MPVHWFYNPRDIVQMFGKVTKCVQTLYTANGRKYLTIINQVQTKCQTIMRTAPSIRLPMPCACTHAHQLLPVTGRHMPASKAQRSRIECTLTVPVIAVSLAAPTTDPSTAMQ